MNASEVMNRSAALLNDVGRTVFTYDAQIPYLNMALDELMESLEEHNISTTNEVSALVFLPFGNTTISTLPSNLVEIRNIHESDAGVSKFVPVNKVSFLSPSQTPSSGLGYWAFQKGQIKFNPSTLNKDILIEYIAKIQPPINDAEDDINIINSKSFLGYRTASLCSEFIGENKERADKLNAYAQLAFDRMIGINIKSLQSEPTRRKPFMAGYKLRGRY